MRTPFLLYFAVVFLALGLTVPALAAPSLGTSHSIMSPKSQRDGLLVAKKGKKSRSKKKKAEPPPPPVEETPPPASPAADTAGGGGEGGGGELMGTRRGPARVDFDDRLIQGQTNKSGAIYIFERKNSEIHSMVRRRTSFREEILRSIE